MRVINIKVKQIVSVLIALIMFSVSITFNSSINVNAANSMMRYFVFDAQDGDYVNDYTLEANAVTDKSRDVIIPDDGRKADNTVIGAVKIILNNGAIGSGFVIDEYTIGTAAHCVFDEFGTLQNSNVSINKILIFDENGDITKTITNVCETHIPVAYISYEDNSIYDYAMITVGDSLEQYMSFNLGVIMDEMVGSDIAVYSTGFPGIVRGELTNGVDPDTNEEIHTKFTDYGKIVDVPNAHPDDYFYYNNVVTGGNSGGPVYIKATYGDDEYLTVIGITSVMTSSGNVYANGGAVRMTTNLLHFYKNNPNI